ncbi:MAG: hypothetical protein ACI85O_002099 [Saprospiraceae bacterium]|jgi:hypothetical protein
MRVILISFLLFTSLSIFGQQKFTAHDYIPGNMPNYKPAYQEDYPSWAKMLYQEAINYIEIEKAYGKWKVNDSGDFRPVEKYYKIWIQKVLPFVAADGSIQLTGVDTYYNNTLSHQLTPITNQQSPIANGTGWEFLGPKETFWLNESGSTQEPEACPWQVNIYTFDVAKTNYSTLYCGTETGFVNKSIDNGETWNLLAQNYTFGGAVTSIAIHSTDENTVYVGAGQQIHKTTDGGDTWTPMLSTGNLFYADKITIDNTNTNKIYAAGSSGVYFSNDAGTTWTSMWNHQSYDVHTKPDNTDIVYALGNISGDFKLAISTDGGATFDTDENFPTQIDDIAGGLIAVSADAPDQLFAILLSNDNSPLIYRGDMVLNTWELIATGQTVDFQLNNGQGFFDLILEVSQTNSDLIFAGTSTLYKSTNGGSNFSIIGGYGGDFPIHPDMQAMKVLDNGTAWIATDGGFTHSTDNFTSIQNAVALNRNLVGSDMWGFDQGWNEDIIVGGRYHNGNTAIADFYQPKALRMGGAESPTGWVMKGKSRQVAFDDLGPGWILPETAESEPQGRFLFSKHPNMDEYGGRRGNMLFHPNYYEVIYLGEGNGFWKSSDMGTSFELLHNFGSRIRFCQIAFDNPNIIYADIVDQGLYRSDDGGYTWNAKPSLTNGSYGNGYWEGKLHFEISPNDANIIYACLQNGTWSSDIGQIFKSTDGGDTWEDWTGSLNEFTKTLVVQPDSEGNDILYLFTDNSSGNPAQCYIRKSGDEDWAIYGESYPAGMSPNHALPFFRDSKIRVAGNGGIWENSLEEPNFQPIVQPWVERPFYNCMLDTIYLEDHSILNHQNATWAWEIQPSPLYIDDANKRNPKIVLGTPGSYDVTLTITKNGNSYTKTIEEMMTTVECPSLENCNNPANLPKEIWELVYVDSEETGQPGLATMSFDNNPETIWHTRWSTGSDPYPHEIQIDLGEVFDIYEFTYSPRQNGQNGRIKDYELYFSEDLEDWGTLEISGEFENSAAPQKISFDTPKIGRYFKLVALSEVNDNAWTSVAEFDINGCYHVVSSTQNQIDYQTLKTFPVPTQGLFEVSLPSNELFNYSIYTLSGQIVKNGKSQVGYDFLQLDLSAFANSMYVIKLVDGNNKSYYVKVVKE